MISFTPEYTKTRIGYLALFGGFCMLLDALWGAISVRGLDWALLTDAALGIVLLLGVPAYISDFLSSRRIVVYLPILAVLRWIIDSYAGPPPLIYRLWHGTEFLIASAALLQLSKLCRYRHGLLSTSGGAP